MSGCGHCWLPQIDPTGEHLFLPRGAVPPPPEALAAGPMAPVANAQWGISVSPSQVIAPVGSEVIMIASVCGSEGFMLTRQRVEWTLDGVGQFMSPGQRHFYEVLDWMHGYPKKIDSRYVVNKTLGTPMTLDRGTPTPTDDVLIQDGQSWLSVTSATEGTSHVTVFAPEIYGWDRRHQSATIYWVDAQWRFPAPAISPAGSPHALTTMVTHQSDNSPLVGWMVRYTIAGGPEAGFAPDGAPSVEVMTNGAGEATVEIQQKQPVAGTNQVNIQVIRPPGMGGQTRPLVLGAGGTSQTWTSGSIEVPGGAPPQTLPAEPPSSPPATQPPPAQAPAQLEVILSGPDTAEVGGDAQFEIEIANRGAAPATRLVVSDRFGAGLVHAVSGSPIERDLADLPPGGIARMNVTFRVTQAGRLCQEVTVSGEGGLRATADKCITATAPAEAAQPPSVERTENPPERSTTPNEEPPATDNAAAAPGAGLSVKLFGPERKKIGEPAQFTIEVTNGGPRAIGDLEIANHFETTLQPLRATDGSTWLQGGALGWKIATLEAGKTIRRAIEFTCLRSTPKACNRVTVTVAGGEQKSEEACVEIVDPAAEAAAAPASEQGQVSVTVADTADPIKVGGATTYQILVSNKGTQSAFDVAVTITYTDEVRIENIVGPVEGRVMPGSVRFAPIRELRAGESPLSFELRGKATRSGTVRLKAEVTSRGQATPVLAEQTTEVIE